MRRLAASVFDYGFEFVVEYRQNHVVLQVATDTVVVESFMLGDGGGGSQVLCRGLLLEKIHLGKGTLKE